MIISDFLFATVTDLSGVEYDLDEVLERIDTLFVSDYSNIPDEFVENGKVSKYFVDIYKYLSGLDSEKIDILDAYHEAMEIGLDCFIENCEDILNNLYCGKYKCLDDYKKELKKNNVIVEDDAIDYNYFVSNGFMFLR